MSTPETVGNGVDRTALSGVTPINGTAAADNSRERPRTQANTTAPEGITNGQIVEPTIDTSVIWQFSIAGSDGRQRALEWGEQTFRAINVSPVTDDAVRNLKIRHAQETLARLKNEFKGHPTHEVVPASDQSDRRRDRHQRAMLWTSYACIGAGFFVLNFTLSSYLMNRGMLDYVDHPWKTYVFSSLPITAAITLKAIAIWFTEETRRRYAIGLGVTGAIIAAIAWAGCFAWLFSPQTGASAMALPGDDDGLSLEKRIGVALVFMHILGETGCAAALGLWAHKLSLKDCVTEPRMTGEFALGEAQTQKVFGELDRLQTEQNEERGYRERFEAGLKAFILKVGA